MEGIGRSADRNDIRQDEGKRKKSPLAFYGLLGLTIALLVVAVFSLSLLGDGGADETKLTIALVNEDQAGTFNDTSYNFGRSFVDLVTNDNKYNWRVASRPVAERAYADGAIQAVIYLPQSFTNNILTLQSIDPQQAEVEYKVLAAQSELDHQVLQNKISDVLYDFNASVVKMYYGSVASNVGNAQTNVAGIVNGQTTFMTNLEQDVYNPFQVTHQGYGSVLSVSSALRTLNEMWIQAQNTFTTSVVDMLTLTSQRFHTSLDTVTDYFTTQQQIIEHNVANANEGITTQAQADNMHYRRQYVVAHDALEDVVQSFKVEELARYDETLAQYHELVDEARHEVETQTAALEAKREELLTLQKDLYKHFFDQEVNPSIDASAFPDLETDAHAREAIATMLARSFDAQTHGNIATYEATIQAMLARVSVDEHDYKALLDALVENKSLTATKRQDMLNQLTVLNNYVTSFDLPRVQLDFTDVPAHNTTEQVVTKQLEVIVPTGQRYDIRLQGEKGLINADILNAKAVNMRKNETVIRPGSWVSLDNRREPGPPDANGNPTTRPARSSMRFTITYQVKLGQKTGGTIKAEWGLPLLAKEQAIDVFTLTPANTISEYVGGAKFGVITDVMQDVQTASELITFFYGKPGASVADMMSITDFKTETDADAVFKMYGNMDQAELARRLSEEDVAQYKAWGTENIAHVQETISTLNTAIDGLANKEVTLGRNLPQMYFSEVSADLQTWYETTMAQIDAQRDTWVENEAVLLEAQQWEGEPDEETPPVIYHDEAGATTVYATIHEMMTSSAEAAINTASSSALIEDNTATFDEMIETVNQTQDAASTLMEQTGQLLDAGATELKKQQDYAENFSTILANTRAGGVDSNAVFAFFAQPLALLNTTPQNEFGLHSFDWQLLAVFAVGMLSGLGAMSIRSLWRLRTKK